MKPVGKFRIKGSFKVTGRGLVVIGDIIEGRVKVEDFVTLDTGHESITLKIGGVEMADNISTKEYFVGLTFVYKHEEERIKLELLKLEEQIIDIISAD